MWEDILETSEKIIYYNKVLNTLPRTKRRAIDHAYYMLQNMDIPLWGEDDTTQDAFATAALHFIGSIKDMLKQDFSEKGIDDLWKNSKEYAQLNTDPLLLILRNIRNYDVHFNYVGYEASTFMYYYKGTEDAESEEGHLYMRKFTWEEYEKWRPGKKDLTEEHINWFNNQIKFWPVKYIYFEALNRYCNYIESFLISLERD